MYLMGLVNSVARRPTDHVELVDLSVEKKKAQDRYNKEHKALTNGTRSPKPSASPRRHALENHPADLVMEPLFPLFLTSASSSDSSDGDTPIGDTETTPCQPQETSANVVEKTEKTEKIEKTEKTIEDDAPSRQLELDQELSRGDKQTEVKQVSQRKIRVAPKLGRMLSDGGVISTRVQRHPLEMIQEQEHSDEHIVRAKIDRPSRVLQHPLERIDEDSPKSRKPATKKERKPARVVAAASQPPARKFVRESVKPPPKRDVNPPPKRDVNPPPKRERAKPRESRAPITKPRNPKPVCEIPNDREKPSLASPVMEKMQGLVTASPEHSWNQKFQNLPKLAVSSVDTEPLMEERELRYSSPKMTESDVQDELSFRVWERESTPKRKSISVSSDFQDLDLETLGHSSIANPKTESMTNVKQKIPEQLSPLRTFRGRATIPKPVDVETHNCEDEIQHEYPSPSSFTCGLSPTSLFSDDDNIFSRFQQFPEFGDATTTTTTTSSTSPRSVLSQQPDEISHFASDSSETRDGHRNQASSSTYNDESSDLESPAELNGRSFSTFTYTDKEMESTTSEDDAAEEAQCDTMLVDGVDGAELRYFQEANHREPWLEKDGGVLDDTDLEFLLPPETTTTIPDNSEITEELPANPRKPKCQNKWIPCEDATRRQRRHSRSSSFSKSNEKLHIPTKRSVKFAPELVREFPTPNPTPNPNPKSLRLPRPESRDDDEHIYPSVKSWEVKDDVDASPGSPPSRRRWRRSLHSKPQGSPECEDDHVASDMSSRRRWRRCRGENGGEHVASGRERMAQMMPCAGRLLQRLAFKVSRSRRVEVSDDESVAGTESFGRSARRDAQQVRRILKGSQKRFSNLTVADILKDNFQS